MGIANDFKKIMTITEAKMKKVAVNPTVVDKAKEIAQNAKVAIAKKSQAAWKLAKAHPVAAGLAGAAGLGLTTAAVLAKKKQRAQEGLELKNGGNNMFKNTLEDVVTERFLTEQISAEKYVKLMEKIEVMSEGKALDILQEITLKQMKKKVVGTAVSIKDKMVALAKSVATTTGAAYGRCLAFIQKYYAKFGALPTKAKVIAAVGTGAAVAGGVVAKKAYDKSKK
jgi:hypothetical protein